MPQCCNAERLFRKSATVFFSFVVN